MILFDLHWSNCDIGVFVTDLECIIELFEMMALQKGSFFGPWVSESATVGIARLGVFFASLRCVLVGAFDWNLAPNETKMNCLRVWFTDLLTFANMALCWASSYSLVFLLCSPPPHCVDVYGRLLHLQPAAMAVNERLPLVCLWLTINTTTKKKDFSVNHLPVCWTQWYQRMHLPIIRKTLLHKRVAYVPS